MGVATVVLLAGVASAQRSDSRNDANPYLYLDGEVSETVTTVCGGSRWDLAIEIESIPDLRDASEWTVARIGIENLSSEPRVFDLRARQQLRIPVSLEPQGELGSRWSALVPTPRVREFELLEPGLPRREISFEGLGTNVGSSFTTQNVSILAVGDYDRSLDFAHNEARPVILFVEDAGSLGAELLGFDPFDIVTFAGSSFESLDPGPQTALLDFVESGGHLRLGVPPSSELLEILRERGASIEVDRGRAGLGFGSCSWRTASRSETGTSYDFDHRALLQATSEAVRREWSRPSWAQTLRDERLYVLPSRAVTTVFLILYGLIVVPFVHLWARRRRAQPRILWVQPAVAIAFFGLTIAIGTASYGVIPTNRVDLYYGPADIEEPDLRSIEVRLDTTVHPFASDVTPPDLPRPPLVVGTAIPSPWTYQDGRLVPGTISVDGWSSLTFASVRDLSRQPTIDVQVAGSVRAGRSSREWDATRFTIENRGEAAIVRVLLPSYSVAMGAERRIAPGDLVTVSGREFTPLDDIEQQWYSRGYGFYRSNLEFLIFELEATPSQRAAVDEDVDLHVYEVVSVSEGRR